MRRVHWFTSLLTKRGCRIVLRRRTGQRLRSSHRNFGAERKTGKRLKEASFLEAVLSLRRLEQGLETRSLAVLPGEVLHTLRAPSVAS